MVRCYPIYTALLLLLLAVGRMRSYAQDPCDTLLHAENLGPLGYANRGDRCEGLYTQAVGSTAIWLVSLTAGVVNMDPAAAAPLEIRWDTVAGAGQVHLRAEGMRRKLYYRMDALQKAGEGSFTWKTNVLSSLGIGPSDIGILGVTSLKIAGSPGDVYLPLRVLQHGRPEPSGLPEELHLLLMPGVELSEVYTSLAPANAAGRPGNFFSKDKKLGFGYYPAERAIDIPLTGMKKRGVYAAQVSATLKNGGTSSIEFLFFYQGH
jgi:hypothetical protein